MTSAAFHSHSEEQEFGYGQLFGVLVRRWPWVVGALALAMAGAVYVSTRAEPVYRSSMQLLVEPNYEEDLTRPDFDGLTDQRKSEQDYFTQLALMRSKGFVRQAVEEMQAEYPDFTMGEAMGGFSLNRLAEGNANTRIFKADFTGDDPIQTKRFLEILTGIYLEYNEAQQADRLRRGLDFINQRLDNTQSNLREAQQSLELFRQNQNLIDPLFQAQTTAEALNGVLREQEQLFVDLSEIESRYATLESQLELSPQSALLASRLSQSSRVQELLGKLQGADLALADRRIIYTDQDPSVQILVQSRTNILEELREEISAVSRQPVEEIDPTLYSFLQLGGIDLNLVSSLLEADASLESIAARWASLSALENELRAELNRYPSLMAEYDRLQPEVEIERSTLQQLLERREQLTAELSRGGYTWQLVEPAQTGFQIGPDPVKPLALGVVAGLFVGGALAFARESMDKVVRSSDDLRRKVPLPVLGILPTQTVRRRFGGNQPSETPMLHPELADSDLIQIVMAPAFRESLDMVANNLQLLLKEPGSSVLAVSSGLPGEGKTTVTLGLAFSLARMSQRVLVIDADLRRSGIQSELGIESSAGLSQLLSGVATSPHRPHRFDFGPAAIDILPSGPSPADPITLLSSPRFERLIDRCKSLYDVVLVDTPPILGMADALKVGAVCNGLLLVSRLERITQPQINQLLVQVAPLKVLGIVANGSRSIPTVYSDYGSNLDRASAATR
jgi:succinoglycan biosynthesis transport protein ExoP